MVKKKKGCTVRYNTDVVAKNIWQLLLRDFRGTEGNSFALHAESSFSKGLTEFRSYDFPELGFINPQRFKRWKQLSSLLKKYRFEHDAYDDASLIKLTKDKFFKEQERISSAAIPTPLCSLVLQRARLIAKGILGKYSPEETLNHARFGKKSSIGCPLSFAYIDEKLSNVRAFTGSTDCSNWFFKDSLPGDPILKELVSLLDIDLGNQQLKHDSLNLVLVPKSWKTLRPITPLTLIALYYSYGVGEQVTSCLKATGLDIRRLQKRHGTLVKEYSVTRSHATADLSSASDSLTSELLNRVLPREWYCAVKKTFSHQLIVDGKIHYTASVLPMGNGLTFPIETLVFYSILQALSELSGIRGTVSVYGDDLIYPVGLHKFVAHVFPRIGLVLNLDKTFVKAPFRESCGSDYYRGVDVRPFQLGDEHQQLTRVSYRAFLYKAYNGLRRRWSEDEIPQTLRWLLAELSFTSGDIFRVPPSFPDTAGIKVDSPFEYPMGCTFLTWKPILGTFANGSRWFSFFYLIEMPDKRFVNCVAPYYWLALQGRNDDPADDSFWVTDYSFYDQVPKSQLSWDKVSTKKWYQTKGKRWMYYDISYTASVASRSGCVTVAKQTKSESVSDWF